jgi:hypothetical protein
MVSLNRRWEFDALRGLMLVLMTVTHLPTQFSSPLGQPFGFVSAAEGFVLLSGLMAGLVYSGRAVKGGPDELRGAFFKRAATVYASQLTLMFFLLTLVALLGALADQPAINNLLGYYRERPLAAVIGGVLLLYAPPLLDILPMYVLFLLLSPVLLLHAQRNGWRGILAISVALWAGAQWGLGRWLFAQLTGPGATLVPYEQTGAFEMLAWQLLWVLGLWLGADQAAAARSAQATPAAEGAAPAQRVLAFPHWALALAAVLFCVGLVWRHTIGQVPFPASPALNPLFSKWHLGPLRMVNLFAMMVLLIHFAEPLKRRLPRLRVLEQLGAASLPVFCAHLVLVLLALALVGAPDPQRSVLLDLALLAGTLASLVVVALCSALIDRRVAQLKARRAAQRKAAPMALRHRA